MATFNELISSPKPVLVDFYATWCGPCKMMPPILDDLKNQMGENVTILTVDVDKNRATAQKYNVRGVPTLVLFQNGEIKWKQSGVRQVDELKSVIEQFL